MNASPPQTGLDSSFTYEPLKVSCVLPRKSPQGHGVTSYLRRIAHDPCTE